jgi:hypothetical protein
MVVDFIFLFASIKVATFLNHCIFATKYLLAVPAVTQLGEPKK